MRNLLCVVLLVGLCGLAAGAQEPAAELKPRGSLFKLGQAIEIAPDEFTENVISIGGAVTVRGRVAESVIVVGGAARVSGEVGGDLIALGGDVTLEAGARVGGDVFTADGRVDRDPDSTVAGEIKEDAWGEVAQGWDEAGQVVGGVMAGRSWYGFVSGLLVSLLIGLFLVHFFPTPMRRQAEAIRHTPWTVVLWGLLALVLLPVLLVLLVATVLGVPLIPVLALLYAVAALMGLVASALLIGGRIARSRPGLPNAVVIGVVVVALVRLIPGLGELVTLAVSLLGFGTVIVTRFGTQGVAVPEGDREWEQA